MGVNWNVWWLIYEYLNNRRQLQLTCLCEWPSFLHSACYLWNATGQYTIGPLLFLVFINDLQDSVKFSTVHLFADDTKCSKVVDCVEDVNKLQSDINDITTWSKRIVTQFKLKSIVIQFCSSPPPQFLFTLARLNMSNKDLGLGLPPITPMVVVTVLDSVMLVSPAALNQRLYRSSVLLLPPVDTGSSQASVIVWYWI